MEDNAQRESDLSVPLLSTRLLFCFVASAINQKENVECHRDCLRDPGHGISSLNVPREIEIPFEARSSARKYETSRRDHEPVEPDSSPCQFRPRGGKC